MLNKVKGKIRRLVKEGVDVIYERETGEYYITHRLIIGEIVVKVVYPKNSDTPAVASIWVAYVDFRDYLTKEEITQIKELLANLFQKQEEEREKYMVKTAIQYLEQE